MNQRDPTKVWAVRSQVTPLKLYIIRAWNIIGIVRYPSWFSMGVRALVDPCPTDNYINSIISQYFTSKKVSRSNSCSYRSNHNWHGFYRNLATIIRSFNWPASRRSILQPPLFDKYSIESRCSRSFQNRRERKILKYHCREHTLLISYDTLGFVSPCTTLSKQVMQLIWETAKGRDDQIDEPIHTDEFECPNQFAVTWSHQNYLISKDMLFQRIWAVIYLLNPIPLNLPKLILLSSSIDSY